MTDEAIYDLYFARNEQAITETSLKYGALCRGIARRILPVIEDAEECVSDTYMTTWNHIPPERPNDFRAWLGKITRNHALTKYRSLNAEKRGGTETALVLDELSYCIAGNDSASDAFDRHAVTDAINYFLSKEPVTSRNIFMRRYWYLDSVASIAKNFGMSESKITSILFRQRKKLRRILEQEGITV